MKKHTLFQRLLLPTIIVLVLLPPLSCFIFYQAANHYAYTQAVHDLETLQQQILPLMNSCFTTMPDNTGSKTNTHSTVSDNRRSGSNKTDYNNDYHKPSDTDTPVTAQQVQNFLSQAGPLAARMKGDAQLLILGAQQQVIYPRDERQRATVAPLAAEFILEIPNPTSTVENNNTVKFKASDGQHYLVNIYQVPTQSTQIRHLITYCPTSQIGDWVGNASILVLAISSLFGLLIFIVLFITIRSVTQSLQRLCRGAERIGNGNFSKIETDFLLQELEDLRLAMNQMSQQLEHAEETQKNFFQNVSHELRNPLMSIGGYAQGIEQGIFQAPQEAAHTILEESMCLTNLVNSLLTLSRLESEQQKITPVPIQIADTISSCTEHLRGLALQRDITLTIVPFDSGLTVFGEEGLLSKILDNLLTNAIRYAKTTVTITVQTTENAVNISVADDGNGITPTDLPHIFERCYKGNGGNFGIGLAIARSATQKLNGQLFAANQTDGGAVFTLSLQKV